MKRIICIFTVLIFIFTAASCGGNKQNTAETAKKTAETVKETQTVTGAITESATDAPAPLSREDILQEKTALFAGDAFTANVTADGAPKDSFAMAIADKFELSSVSNVASDGMTAAEIKGKPTVVSQLESETGNKYDYVIIECGITDAAMAVDIGRIVVKSAEETKPEDLDLTTFAGGFENILMTAKKLFADAYIGCVIAPKITSEKGCVSDMRRYAEVMRLDCEKWGVFVLDIYDEEIPHLVHSVLIAKDGIHVRDESSDWSSHMQQYYFKHQHVDDHIVADGFRGRTGALEIVVDCLCRADTKFQADYNEMLQKFPYETGLKALKYCAEESLAVATIRSMLGLVFTKVEYINPLLKEAKGKFKDERVDDSFEGYISTRLPEAFEKGTGYREAYQVNSFRTLCKELKRELIDGIRGVTK